MGEASFYANKFEARTTANGEKYKHTKLTAAHRTLPFGTILKVRNLNNNKEVTVRVNDRGPFVKGRIIDLSKSAAEKLDFINQGITDVEIMAVDFSEELDKPSSTRDKFSEPNSNPINEYYSLKVNRLNLSGYGVQIGSFKEMVNLVQLANELQKDNKDRIFIQVSVIQDIKYYKVIVGNLNNKLKADKLSVRLERIYPDCFVIKF